MPRSLLQPNVRRRVLLEERAGADVAPGRTGDAAIGEAIGGELVVADDAAEQSAGGDSGRIAPGAQGAEGAGTGAGRRGADLVAGAFLVGLACGVAAGAGRRGSRRRPRRRGRRVRSGADRRRSEEEESVVAPTGEAVGGAVARRRRSSAATTAVFWEGAVPRVRRIPAMVVRCERARKRHRFRASRVTMMSSWTPRPRAGSRGRRPRVGRGDGDVESDGSRGHGEAPCGDHGPPRSPQP
jgi:hypothetical protein